MKENAFQKQVIQELRNKNYLVIKNKADLSTGRGIPDLTVFLGNNKVIFVEIKTDTGKLSQEQVEVHKLIDKYNYAKVYIVSPKNYESFVKEVINL